MFNLTDEFSVVVSIMPNISLTWDEFVDLTIVCRKVMDYGEVLELLSAKLTGFEEINAKTFLQKSWDEAQA